MQSHELPAESEVTLTQQVNLNGLKPGDILLFRPPKKVGKVQQFIMFMQSLVYKQTLGHYDTTHAAICVGYENGEPMIAHVTENQNVSGYTREPLRAMLNRDGGDRPFLAFRPTNDFAAETIAQVANDANSYNGKLKWKAKSAAVAFTHRSESHPTDIEQANISDNTFCSKYVIEVMQKAATVRYRRGLTVLDYPNIHASSTPRALEHYLQSNRDHYQPLCYLGINAYQNLVNEVELQLNRIKTRTGKDSRKKYADALLAFTSVIESNQRDTRLNELQKSLRLVSAMLPILSKKTGLFSTTSDKAVLKTARKMGIFKENIDRYAEHAIARNNQPRRGIVT